MAVVAVAQRFNMLAAQDWTWEVTSATASFLQLSDGTHTQNSSGSFA